MADKICSENIVLSIGMLISNRLDDVKKSLASIKPILEKVNSELICVDTVGPEKSDGSLAVAKEYTKNVYHFDWCNDFSKARNVSVDNAKGEWYMFMDDDEWFEDPTEIIDFFNSGEYKNYNSATYVIRNYKTLEGKEFADTHAIRMAKRTEGFRFVGRIHETFSKVSLPCKEFKAFVHHYGYAYKNDEERLKHSERNVTILEEELKNKKDDVRLHAQMALELASVDNERALAFVEETLERLRIKKDDANYKWMQTLKFPLYEALKTDLHTVSDEFSRLMIDPDTNETMKLAVCFSYARILILAEKYKDAVPVLHTYFEMYGILKNDATKRQLQNAADFGKYLSDAYKAMAEEFMGGCMQMGYVIHTKSKALPEGTIEEKLECMKKLNFEELKDCIKDIMKNTPSCFEDEFLNAALDSFSKSDNIGYCCLLYMMAEEEIKRSVKNGADGKAISELFEECILTERRMYEQIYRPECLTEKGVAWLPSDVRYNAMLYGFLNGGKKDLKVLLEAAKLRNDMALVIKTWLGAL